jgi:hypothetical protein
MEKPSLTLRRNVSALIVATLLMFALSTTTLRAQTTAFTYQGRLSDSSMAASGTYDFQFALYDAASGGTQQPDASPVTVTRSGVDVNSGVFTMPLDFGAEAFPGADRFLEIRVKRPAESTYTTLTPRQQVTSTPYSIRAVSAGTADTANDAASLGGTAASEFVQNGDARLTDSRMPTAGSDFYIQNQNAATQASANFNISGDGTLGGTLSARTVNSNTGFNIGGNRILSFDNDNLLAGGDAGASINSTGNSNSFFGSSAGRNNTSGSRNAFAGFGAGFSNTTGNDNSFVGLNAGFNGTTGGNNTIIGSRANVSVGNLDFAAAFGSYSRVSASDTIVLGKAAGTYNGSARPADAVQIPGSLTVSGTLNASGANLTSLNASNITSGTLDAARIPNLDAAKITTGIFDAARVPNLDAAKITSGTFDMTRIPNLDASKITTGTLADARLSSNVATLTGPQIFTDAKTFSGGISGNGSGLTNLNASNIASGTLDTARIPDLGASYIRNQTTQQTSSNFNISGDGTAGGGLFGNTINSATQFNISGNRVLGAAGTSNLFAGIGTGSGGSNNSFFGASAGAGNTTGSGNAFLGKGAGASNTEGNDNVFLGRDSGSVNTTGGSNAFVGKEAGLQNTTGSSNSLFGASAGKLNTEGHDNAFVGVSAGFRNTTGFNNTAVGASAGFLNVTGNNNTFIGANTETNADGLSYATAIGAGARVNASNSIVLGRQDGSDEVQVIGVLRVFGLAAGPGSTLCRNNNGELSVCSSSIRYKTNVADFSSGLSLINKLRPVTFDWKADGTHDVGFIAEEVNAAEPLLTIYNNTGQVEGVKYDRMGAIFVNAFKEQQTQIERQQKQIDELKGIVCAIKPDAAVCKAEVK